MSGANQPPDSRSSVGDRPVSTSHSSPFTEPPLEQPATLPWQSPELPDAVKQKLTTLPPLAAASESGAIGTEDPFATRPDDRPPLTTPEVFALQPGAEPLPGYRLLVRLGKGGFGEVWKALGPGEVELALKFVRLGSGASSAELQALHVIKNIRHVNLLALFGAWHQGGWLIIAMELADRSLWDRYQEAVQQGLKCLPPRELLRYARDVAALLDYLNKPRHFLGGPNPVGIQHCDIKPQNLLLLGTGIKVGDFGLVRILERFLAPHEGGWTLSYAAPEFFQGHASRHSDQYSLAMTYCHLRGGRLPFTGRATEIMDGHVNRPPDLAMLPPEERPTVARALAKSPQQRWPNCRTFIRALAESVGSVAPAGTDSLPATSEVPTAPEASLPVPEPQTRSARARPIGGPWKSSAPLHPQSFPRSPRRRLPVVLLLVQLACVVLVWLSFGPLARPLGHALEIALDISGERLPYFGALATFCLIVLAGWGFIRTRKKGRERLEREATGKERGAREERPAYSEYRSMPIGHPPASTHAHEVGDEPIPGYRLVKFFGRGGFGEVWQATAPGGTECALKIIRLIDRQGLKEFRAIRLVKRIRHPHLVVIMAYWLKDDYGNILDVADEQAEAIWLGHRNAELIIAMGLGDKNLAERLQECKAQGESGIPVEELLGYMEEVAKAIDFLNQPTGKAGTDSPPHSIQHCDIKPQNIILVGGSAQVCDFGLARQLGDVRKTSTAAGSYAYIAPEAIENRTSRAIDQYSLAISYVELRTGSLPFSTNSLYEVMFAHLQGKLDFSKLSEGERPVLKRATALNPDERFPTTLEMVRSLRRAIEGTKSSKPPATTSGPFRMNELLRPGIEIVPGHKLVHLIGRGGYGEVWRAAAPGGMPVALKLIRNLEAGGKQEFRALELLKSLDHNHLMELRAYWLLDSNGDVMTEELRQLPDAPPASILVVATKLASKNLKERLDECRRAQGGKGGIPLPELIGYMRQAAAALDHLNAPIHQLGTRKVAIQHRDIKPENILLAANTIKVSDFGLAKVLEGTSAVIHGDSAGLTLSYAAPEVFSNKVTSWSDQYSLAITYCQLRSGELPFKAKSPAEVFLTHVEGKLDLAQLPKAERAVIARATAVVPDQRFPSCTAMLLALEHACGLASRSVPTIESGPGDGDSLPTSVEPPDVTRGLGRPEENPDASVLADTSDSVYSLPKFDADTGQRPRAATVRPADLGVVSWTGHLDAVWCVSFGPEGRCAASGGLDNTVRLWNVSNGRQLHCLTGHEEGVTGVAFSPDGRFVLSSSLDRTARLWNAESGQEVRSFHGHAGRVLSVAISPNGRHAVTASEDQTTRLWNLDSGLEVRCFRGHHAWVTSVVFSPNGQHILSGGEDGAVLLWQADSGENVCRFAADPLPVRSLSFSPDGRQALVARVEGILTLHDVRTGQQVRHFAGHGDWVRSVAFSGDGRFAISGSDDETVRVWRTATGEEIDRLDGFPASALSVVFAPDGGSILTGWDDNAIRLWRLAQIR
jgi:serine/threonine protein kinase